MITERTEVVKKEHREYQSKWRKTKSGRLSIKRYIEKYNKTYPWAKCMRGIISRCSGKIQPYHKRGIKNFLTIKNLKILWFRDKAYLLKEPSIDRIDTHGHYTLENCRYIELTANKRRRRK